MRDLAPSDTNTVKITDTVSASEIELRYRLPTTQEVVAYQNKLIKKLGGKVVNNIVPTRIEFALKILVGFRDGDFGYNGSPISVDPKSPNYREDWKALLEATAPDILSTFGYAIFEGVRVGSVDIGDDGGAPDDLPL